MDNVRIDEIDILPLAPKKGRIASVSFVLNSMFKITNVSIYTRPNGDFRLVYPTKMLPNGQEEACFKPITREAAAALNEALIGAFKLFVMDKAIEDDFRENS
ncbi:MAG: hypothetical protein ABIE84_06510 [bacterium]